MSFETPFEIIQLLKSHNVPFLVIGGVAVNFHGYIRATEDVDVIFARNSDSEIKLLNSLQSCSASWISNEIDPDTKLEKTVPVNLTYIQATHIMMLTTTHGYLDIFDYVPGNPDLSIEELFQDSEELDGVKFISLKWLKKIKKAANRPKDRDDLENLP